MTKCNHVVAIDYIDYEGGGLVYADRGECGYLNTYDPENPGDKIDWFDYCPRCGEKLEPPEGTEEL